MVAVGIDIAGGASGAGIWMLVRESVVSLRRPDVRAPQADDGENR